MDGPQKFFKDGTPKQRELMDVAFDNFWPTKDSEGSTFCYDNWSIHLARIFQDKGYLDADVLRPFDYMRLKDVEPTVAMTSTKVSSNDRIPTQLKADLVRLRNGEITSTDPCWRQYTLNELSFALRRSSISMCLHMLNALLSTHHKVLQDMVNVQSNLLTLSLIHI